MKTESVKMSSYMSRRQTAFWLSAILVAALTLRVYASFFSGLANYNTDTYSYFKMADAIIAGEPISYFPNGYPLIVSIVKLLFGDSALVINVILIINVTFSTLIVLMSYFIARSFLSPLPSLLACSMVAFWPNQINYVRHLLSEVPATFSLTLGMLLLLRAMVATKERLRSFAAGFFLFLSGLIRSTLSPLGFLVAAYLLLLRQKRTAVLLLAGLMVGIFTNLILIHTGVIAEPSNTGGNLLLSINKSSGDNAFFSAVQFSDEEKSHPLSTYVKFAMDYPSEFIRLRLSSFWELWGPWPSPGDPHASRSVLSRALIGVRFPLLLVALLGVWLNRRSPATILIGLPIMLITVVHVVFFSSPRFTYTVEPLVIILAMAGLYGIYGKLTFLRRSRGAMVESGV